MNRQEQQLELTPRANTILEMAQTLAQELGHDYIGVEHLFLAIMEEGNGLPAKVLAAADPEGDLVRRMRDEIGQPGVSSNRMLDEEGNVVGFLVGHDENGLQVVDVHGDPVMLRTDERRGAVAVDAQGHEVAALPIDQAPLMVDRRKTSDRGPSPEMTGQLSALDATDETSTPRCLS